MTPIGSTNEKIGKAGWVGYEHLAATLAENHYPGAVKPYSRAGPTVREPSDENSHLLSASSHYERFAAVLG